MVRYIVLLFCIVNPVCSLAVQHDNALNENSSRQSEKIDEKKATAEITELLNSIKKALNEDDKKSLGSYGSASRMAREVEKQSEFELDPAKLDAFRKNLQLQMSEILSQSFGIWERLNLNKVEFINEGKQAKLSLRVWDAENYTNRLRIWITKEDEEWKVYDIEDLSTSGRISVIAGAAIIEAVDEGLDARQLRKDIKNLQKAGLAIAEEDFETARELLDEMKDAKFPKAMAGLRCLFMASLAIADLEPQLAHDYLDQSARDLKDCPIRDYMRAVAYNMAGDSELALKSARTYLTEFGDDADAYLEIGHALSDLNRPEEAMDAYRKGIDDTPDSLDNLLGLGLLLPEDDKAELTSRFQKLRQPADNFELLANEFINYGDIAALEAITEGLRKIATDDLNVVYYDAYAKNLRKQYLAAIELLKPVLIKIDDEEERWYYVELALDSAIAAGKPMLGYQSVPEEDKSNAYEYLTRYLIASEKYDLAKSFVTEYQKQFPQVALPYYHLGEIHFWQDNFTEADQAYEATEQLKLDEGLREDLRLSRVACWFHLQKGLEAYERFPPHDDTFDQLANLYRFDEDGEGLQALVDRHQKRVGLTDEILLKKIEANWYQQKYLEVIDLVETTRVEKRDPNFASGELYQDAFIRSLLRTKQFDKAQKTVNSISSGDEARFLQAVVSAAAGETEKCLAAIVQCLESDSDDAEQFLQDPDVSPALQTESFAKVLARLEAEDSVKSFVLFLREPLELNAEILAAAANRAWHTKLVVQDGFEGDNFVVQDEPHVYAIDSDGIFLGLLDGNGTYNLQFKKVAENMSDKSCREAYLAHRSWIDIDYVFKRDDKSFEAVYQLLGKLVAELAEQHNGILVKSTQKQTYRVVDAELLTQLRGKDPLKVFSRKQR